MDSKNEKLMNELIAESDSYQNFTQLPNGKLAATMNLAFTCAVVSGLHEYGYEGRWCYHNRFDAQDALEEWAETPDQIEPTGWHRHPATGRRVREDGSTYINF